MTRETQRAGGEGHRPTSPAGAVATPPRPPAISVRQAAKTYPGNVRAVRDVDLEIGAGSVHAFVGENGAGKSTLAKIIAGAVRPDAGDIRIDGEPIDPGDPKAALEAGVAMIYQEPAIVGTLSPVANVFLGQETSRLSKLSSSAMRDRYAQLCDDLGVTISPRAQTSALPRGKQRTLEVLRAQLRQAKVVIMDEVTGSLTGPEREGVYRVIRRLKERGVSVVLISHNLDEVIEVCDTVSVFRDGRHVLTRSTAGADTGTLINAMLGHELEKAQARVRKETEGAPRRARGAPALEVRGLTVPGKLEGVDLTLRDGEVLGLAGLVGSGRSTLLKTLVGAIHPAAGEMWVDGKAVRWPKGPSHALRRGILLAPEDRRSEGLVPEFSCAENIALPKLGRSLRAPSALITRRRLVRAAEGPADRASLARAKLAAPARTLSGGNQQKVVLAKVLDTRPKIVLLDEPFRGIDVGAKAQLLELISLLTADGLAVIVACEEIEELEALAERIAVLSGGSIRGVHPAGVGRELILRQMFPPS
ncbi:Arabinose import ATP-binding protein AraG [Baekduia alba]|uniref:sugar ABC transporter ATP-binding protein n=1 Tax=Baekduia alba TaxID=2997333 RepID=UPI0023410C40|nr:sugar ABC transporter ATP-binding protein [Baekduia alba]WCB94913.1 Arabinose import ATP-binding protein AraG [Baekduia alba]